MELRLVDAEPVEEPGTAGVVPGDPCLLNPTTRGLSDNQDARLGMDAEDRARGVGQFPGAGQTASRLAGDSLELRNCGVCQRV